MSFVCDVIAFTQSYIRSHFWRLLKDLVEQGKVFAAIDEFEALVVLPVVELVGGRDAESREERGLIGDAGEGEGRVPGDGRREVYGEGGDAVAVVNPRISISCVPSWSRRETCRPSYLNPAFGAISLLNLQLLSTRTTFSSGSSRSIVFVSLNTLGSSTAVLYLISRSRPVSVSQLPVMTTAYAPLASAVMP